MHPQVYTMGRREPAGLPRESAAREGRRPRAATVARSVYALDTGNQGEREATGERLCCRAPGDLQHGRCAASWSRGYLWGNGDPTGILATSSNLIGTATGGLCLLGRSFLGPVEAGEHEVLVRRPYRRVPEDGTTFNGADASYRVRWEDLLRDLTSLSLREPE